MKRLIIYNLFILFLFSNLSFAQEDGSVRQEDKLAYLTGLDYIDTLTQPVKRTLRDNNIDLNFFAGVLQGLDTNVNLDSEKKVDGFLETSLNAELTYNYNNDLRIRVENYTTDILYYNVNSANLLDVYNEVAMETDLFNKLLTAGGEYAFEYVLFPNDEDGTYFGNHARAYLKHRITRNIYHEISYKFLIKSFTHDKTLAEDDTRTDKLRQDVRNALEYEIGFYIMDKAILKTDIEIYKNNGNYQYFDYYDYYSFKVRPSLVLMFTDKFYGVGSFSYQHRGYDDRLSTKNDERVMDDTYIFNGSLLYDISKSFTFAFNYSWRQNSSNEPNQKYAGTILTAGLYYYF